MSNWAELVSGIVLTEFIVDPLFDLCRCGVKRSLIPSTSVFITVQAFVWSSNLRVGHDEFHGFNDPQASLGAKGQRLFINKKS